MPEVAARYEREAEKFEPSFYDEEVLDALKTAEIKRREEMKPSGWEMLGGRYRRLYEMGEGGMGAVDLALDEQTGRLVVVKRILPSI